MPAITNAELEIRQRMQAVVPNTHGAISYLVPALEDAYKSIGKRTIFGKDKFAAEYQKCLEKITKVLFAMEQDGLCGPGIDEEETESEFFRVMGFFAHAYPNWPDAYAFFGTAFHANRDEHLRPLIRKFVLSRNLQSTDKWQNLLNKKLDDYNKLNETQKFKQRQSLDENILKMIEPELVQLMALKLKEFPILLKNPSLIQKTDAKFIDIYDSLKDTHSLAQIIDEVFRRAFPPNGVPQIENL